MLPLVAVVFIESTLPRCTLSLVDPTGSMSGHPQVTPREEHIMEARINRRTLWIIIGGAVAVLFAGVAIVDADTNAAPHASAGAVSSSVQLSEVAAWASANGLAGSSPAGLAVPVRSYGQPEVAAWAAANGLSGSSPAGLAVVPAGWGGQSEVAAWANAGGLSGLSPASLRRIDN